MRSWPPSTSSAGSARPKADPATLIRRVYVDLTGLVPNTEQVRTFVADPSDHAL